jgi:hypothetical protein
MKIYDDLLEHIRRRIQLHEIAGDFAIATESLKIYLDEWEKLSKLHQPTVSESVCSTCRFNKSNTYHDKMWCRDCRQGNHFEQTVH